MSDRRQRIHSLVVALLAHQSDLELLDDDRSGPGGHPLGGSGDAGSWLERNRRYTPSLTLDLITGIRYAIAHRLGGSWLNFSYPNGWQTWTT